MRKSYSLWQVLVVAILSAAAVLPFVALADGGSTNEVCVVPEDPGPPPQE